MVVLIKVLFDGVRRLFQIWLIPFRQKSSELTLSKVLTLKSSGTAGPRSVGFNSCRRNPRHRKIRNNPRHQTLKRHKTNLPPLFSTSFSADTDMSAPYKKVILFGATSGKYHRPRYNSG